MRASAASRQLWMTGAEFAEVPGIADLATHRPVVHAAFVKPKQPPLAPEWRRPPHHARSLRRRTARATRVFVCGSRARRRATVAVSRSATCRRHRFGHHVELALQGLLVTGHQRASRSRTRVHDPLRIA
jgi:hypothetical protein